MINEIEKTLKENVNCHFLQVELAGNHCTVNIASDDFVGLNTVKRHQKIYQVLNDRILSGELHAVNINAFSNDEWEAQQ